MYSLEYEISNFLGFNVLNCCVLWCRFVGMLRQVRVKGVLMLQWLLIMPLKMQLMHWMDWLVSDCEIWSMCFFFFLRLEFDLKLCFLYSNRRMLVDAKCGLNFQFRWILRRRIQRRWIHLRWELYTMKVLIRCMLGILLGLLHLKIWEISLVNLEMWLVWGCCKIWNRGQSESTPLYLILLRQNVTPRCHSMEL